jgi:hypothetical protein
MPKTVEIFGNACFEGCNQVEIVLSESASEFLRISGCAVRNYLRLKSISIPASVPMIGDVVSDGAMVWNRA